MPAGYGRTRTHSQHAQCTRGHARVHVHTPRTHLGMLVSTHAHTTGLHAHAHTHCAGCLPYKERSVGRNDGTVPYASGVPVYV